VFLSTWLYSDDNNDDDLLLLAELLWTAPEVLRNDDLSGATNKADVYSFSIIMQEVIIRSYPFEMLDKSYEGLFISTPLC